MDDVARYNRERWAVLVREGALFARPHLRFDVEAARRFVDPRGVLGDLDGTAVLCLASGGGKQSVACALLGAHVTVLDLSSDQLALDEAAAHYGLGVVPPRRAREWRRLLSPI